MNLHSLTGGMILALFAATMSTGAAAEEAQVKITFPADGAKLDAMSQSRVDYEVSPGPRGDHVHIYMDGKETAVLRKLSGSHPLDAMTAGAHTLCIKVVNKAHVPIGVEKCVKVNVE